MIFEVLTLFPEGIEAFVAQGLLGKAVASGRIALHCTNYRDFSQDPHRKVDDIPYGGGAGMVMGPQPVVDALQAIETARGRPFRVLLSPSGVPFTQAHAKALAKQEHLAFLCGRYEGIDDRVREGYVDACFSLGDFVLNGGEVAALAMIEAIARLREGVLGNPASIEHESFAPGSTSLCLEHPQYTRPPNFRGLEVPELLRGGDHTKIEAWRHRVSVLRTWMIRPDLRTNIGASWPEHLPPRGWLLIDPALDQERKVRLKDLAERAQWSYLELGPGPKGLPASIKRFVSRHKKKGPVRIMSFRGMDWISAHQEQPALPDLWQSEPPRDVEQATQTQWCAAMELLFAPKAADASEPGAGPALDTMTLSSGPGASQAAWESASSAGTLAIYWPANPEAPPDSSSAKVDLSLGVAAAPAGIDLALCQRMIDSPKSHTPWTAMCDRLETVLRFHRPVNEQQRQSPQAP